MSTKKTGKDETGAEHDRVCFDYPGPLKHIRLRMRIGSILFPKFLGFRTWRIGLNSFLKAGMNVDLAEAHTMRYLAEHTSIPVPKVQRAWRCTDGITYIIMDLVPGENLRSLWLDMDERTKGKVIARLKEYMTDLRTLQPPKEGIVAAIDGGPLRDNCRMGSERYGPFDTHQDFHHFIRGNRPVDGFGKSDSLNGRAVVLSHLQNYLTKFTHGDFAPRNVMVKKDGTITAIVDWDCAGWYPEYWEFTKARFAPNAPQDWVDRIGDITGEYTQQLDGERALWRIFGTVMTTPELR